MICLSSGVKIAMDLRRIISIKMRNLGKEDNQIAVLKQTSASRTGSEDTDPEEEQPTVISNN